MQALRRWKIALFLLSLVPLGLLIVDTFADRLGANPIEEITHRTGEWALRFLLLTLAVTPARLAFNAPRLLAFRRTLGLFAFFYAGLHFTTYIWLDQFFDARAMAADILERPFITLGFAAFVILIPLAATSTGAMMRRLGQRWQQLHRLVYLATILAVLHFWLLVKADIREPAVYAAVLTFLLGVRLWRARRRAMLQATSLRA